MSVMTWGLSWWDPGPLEEAVVRAADRYKEKHGETPNICFVHPSVCEDGMMVNGCKIVSHKAVLENCYWIGVEE